MYFKVNIDPVICPQIYPLPSPKEMFSVLANGESFTRLDLAQAYRQMKVKPECRHLLTINTHLVYSVIQDCYLTYPQSRHCGRKPWHIFFRDYRALLFLYVDEILVTGRTREEHIKTLHNVLDRLRQAGLRLKRSKCLFFPSHWNTWAMYIISKEEVT